MSEEKRQAISPLPQRMIDDMRRRKLERRTLEIYIRGVCRLAKYLGRSPQTATAEELRRFQLHVRLPLPRYGSRTDTTCQPANMRAEFASRRKPRCCADSC